jgi:hypothetical protein
MSDDDIKKLLAMDADVAILLTADSQGRKAKEQALNRIMCAFVNEQERELTALRAQRDALACIIGTVDFLAKTSMRASPSGMSQALIEIKTKCGNAIAALAALSNPPPSDNT